MAPLELPRGERLTGQTHRCSSVLLVQDQLMSFRREPLFLLAVCGRESLGSLLELRCA